MRASSVVEDLYIGHSAAIIINQANSKDTQNKTKQNTKQTTKPEQDQKRTHENDWQPVHWWIHAGDGNIVSPHPSVAKQKQTTKQRKGGTKTQSRPYTQVREATQHHAETRDPPSQDPRDHMAQAEWHNVSPKFT